MFKLIKPLFAASLILISNIAAAETVLVVLAHPDDELSINGTINHLVLQGNNVHVAYTTSGKYGTHVREPATTPEQLVVIREAEALAALQVLGVTSNNVHFLQMDDYVSDFYQLLPAVQQLYTNLQPAMVITFGPDGLYGHLDHKVTSLVASYAFNKAPNSKVLLNLAISESRDAGYGFTVGKGTPNKGGNVVHAVADESVNYLVDVTAYTAARVQSMMSYQSQYLDPELAVIQQHYESASCVMEPVPFSCEQFILGGIKRDMNLDAANIIGLLNLSN